MVDEAKFHSPIRSVFEMLCDMRLGIVMEKNRALLLTSAGYRRWNFQCISSIC